MQITTLGSGAWEGTPAAFCGCSVCLFARDNPISKEVRTRPAFLMQTTSNEPFLLEVGPDIRIQSSFFKLSPIYDILLSHSHFDHLHGLYDLHSYMKRLPRKLRVHCSEKTAVHIRSNLGHLPIEVHIVNSYETFELNGIQITPLPVYHMFADDTGVPEEALNNTYAYMLEAEDKRVVYLADYFRIPQKSQDAIRDVDVVIADGTYLFTEEYRATKRNHLHGKDIIEFTKSLHAPRVCYFSISHLTQKTHDEMQALLPPSHFIIYDGMSLM